MKLQLESVARTYAKSREAMLHGYLDYDLITIRDAADLLGKSVHNISYLINYKRINKYDEKGNIVKKIEKGRPAYVSKSELLDYWKKWNHNLKKRRESLNVKDDLLAFYHVSEKERTKHVHRLHPYLGKFIPQLVEHFVSKNFSSNEIILDPFMGSGTTLVVASEFGIRSIGVDISEFNRIIGNGKLMNYDLDKVESEIREIYNLAENFSDSLTMSIIEKFEIPLNKDYLDVWFAKRTLMELLFYGDLIRKFQYQDVLKLILTRSARSSRLVHHYDIATPNRPVTEPYTCRKHQDKICTPIDKAIGKLRVYSFDTIERLRQFSKLRKSTKYMILQGDSRHVDILKEMTKTWGKRELINGIFTSPPYVGQIDYHEQHRYAYELLDIDRNDEKEIGPKRNGKGRSSQARYQNDITEVFVNMSKYLTSKAKIFIVANDKFEIYPKIISDSNLEVTNIFERPVEARTEGDKAPYSEKVFQCRVI
jgi:DNA modification methylase